MPTPEASGADDHYDEFGYFHENAAEVGLPWDGPPVVARRSVALGESRALSALVWGEAPPELVLLHGGAQNAHTWDTVALALGRPLVAVDLPGHGHSADRRPGSAALEDLAADVVVAVRALAPDARAVVGMSLGGLTAVTLAGLAPELVRRLVLVDITPGVTPAKAAAIIAFVHGPESFASFEEILARTVEHNPTRSLSSLRRGVLHNAVQRPDGRWAWRHARPGPATPPEHAGGAGDDPGPGSATVGTAPGGGFSELPRLGGVADLWGTLQGLTVPVMLVRGTRPQSVVDDADVAELRRRVPGARVERVDAGHSVQGDDPLTLAALIADFVGPG